MTCSIREFTHLPSLTLFKTICIVSAQLNQLILHTVFGQVVLISTEV